ncbi:hypothetical protein Pav013_2814 [Pseudomonas syringae pv. avellanae str. ISPaVe013]|nr:hypothetical protein Pav013_2814 [Pseudomonas syringae pv. avellanae str. ISPaVe013]
MTRRAFGAFVRILRTCPGACRGDINPVLRRSVLILDQHPIAGHQCDVINGLQTAQPNGDCRGATHRFFVIGCCQAKNGSMQLGDILLVGHQTGPQDHVQNLLRHRVAPLRRDQRTRGAGRRVFIYKLAACQAYARHTLGIIHIVFLS